MMNISTKCKKTINLQTYWKNMIIDRFISCLWKPEKFVKKYKNFDEIMTFSRKCEKNEEFTEVLK